MRIVTLSELNHIHGGQFERAFVGAIIGAVYSTYQGMHDMETSLKKAAEQLKTMSTGEINENDRIKEIHAVFKNALFHSIQYSLLGFIIGTLPVPNFR